MNFRTTFNIKSSPVRITHTDRVMLIGSCFASSIGDKLADGKISVMTNPAGTVYNPVSVSNTLDIITSGRLFQESDLYHYNNMWLSFFHYTDFSSEDVDQTLDKINTMLVEAGQFLERATFLIITFGTARVYRWKESGMIVSNCHKIPSERFITELLSVNEIVEIWSLQLDRLTSLYPDLRILFTISPVRHLKDGAHGNQISKSVLFLAVEELLEHKSGPGYFPAFELIMDDLRDYRFYKDDMIHPSPAAINYIWERFKECYFDNETDKLWNEASRITMGLRHRFNTGKSEGKKLFAQRMITLISDLEKKLPSVDFSQEKYYYEELRAGGLTKTTL